MYFATYRSALVLLACLLGASAANAQAVEPPQGYIGIAHDFGVAPPRYGQQTGFYNIDYDLKLGTDGAGLAGTFWALNFSFRNSTRQLPPNHANRFPLTDQGGYLGVQVKSATESIAIFSIWWTLKAQAGPGAACLAADESWITDEGRIAGGPYRSCRLPITLAKGVKYRLRLAEISDAAKPGQPEWWGAWLINLKTGQERLIGRLQTRGDWGWLNTGTGGFIEHFGPMPNGCASIPKSQSEYFAASADYGSFKSTVDAYVYGSCAAIVTARSTIACTAASCKVTVR